MAKKSTSELTREEEAKAAVYANVAYCYHGIDTEMETRFHQELARRRVIREREEEA